MPGTCPVHWVTSITIDITSYDSTSGAELGPGTILTLCMHGSIFLPTAVH